MLHVGDLHAGREVPLAAVADPHDFAAPGAIGGGQFAGLERATVPDQLAIELQVADIGPWLPVGQPPAVDVVEDFGVAEVVVEGEGAGDVPLTDPVDQLACTSGYG